MIEIEEVKTINAMRLYVGLGPAQIATFESDTAVCEQLYAHMLGWA